jgi:hypothetical protein
MSHPNTLAHIRTAVATGGPGGAWHALDLAIAAAKGAGEQVIRDSEALTPREQLAVALQAAVEVLEGLGVALAEDAEG